MKFKLKSIKPIKKIYKVTTKILVILIAFIYLWNLLDGYTGDYMFAISKQDNTKYFSKEYKDANLNHDAIPYNNVIKNYSPWTDVIIPNAKSEKNEIPFITIEHCVNVNEVDKNRIPFLKNNNSNNLLFSGIYVYLKNVKEIDLRDYYNGKELDLVGTCIYEYKKDSEGNYTIISQVKDISNNKMSISEDGFYIFAKIYKSPILQRNVFFTALIPKRFWFPHQIKQTLKIKYINDASNLVESNYQFKLNWVEWMSEFSKIISVT